MALLTFSQSSKTIKLFSLKLYKIRVRLFDSLVQNLESFTTPRQNPLQCSERVMLQAHILELKGLDPVHKHCNKTIIHRFI